MKKKALFVVGSIVITVVIVLGFQMHSGKNKLSAEEREKLHEEHVKAVAEELLDSIEWKDDATEEKMRQLVFEVINKEK